jgi:hypothetical protein
MENKPPFAESKILKNLNPHPDFFNLTKIGMIVDCGNLRFECSSMPIETNQYYFSDKKIEQAISGYSEPIDNEVTLNNSTYSRQPYTNLMFKDKEIYIHIKEEKKPEDYSARTNRHFLYSHTSSKHGQQTAFHWVIDDRSLFTRLCLLQASSSKLFLTLRLSKDDNYFKELIDKGENKINDFIALESLHFHFK